jgi:hypothetical protein
LRNLKRKDIKIERELLGKRKAEGERGNKRAVRGEGIRSCTSYASVKLAQ